MDDDGVAIAVIVRFVEEEEDLVWCGRACRAWRDASRGELKRRRQERELQLGAKRRRLQDQLPEWRGRRNTLADEERDRLDLVLRRAIFFGRTDVERAFFEVGGSQ